MLLMRAAAGRKKGDKGRAHSDRYQQLRQESGHILLPCAHTCVAPAPSHPIRIPSHPHPIAAPAPGFSSSEPIPGPPPPTAACIGPSFLINILMPASSMSKRASFLLSPALLLLLSSCLTAPASVRALDCPGVDIQNTAYLFTRQGDYRLPVADAGNASAQPELVASSGTRPAFTGNFTQCFTVGPLGRPIPDQAAAAKRGPELTSPRACGIFAHRTSSRTACT